MAADRLAPAPVVNERGERLLRIVPADARAAAAVAVEFALVAAGGGDGMLLVHNRRRQVWELPGGFVDAESPEACARREFAEETGQAARGLRWRALLELQVPTAGSRHPSIRWGALFSADPAAAAPFVPNAEIDALGLWPAAAPPPGTSAIDAALLAFLA